MIARVQTACLVGLEAQPVQLEVDLASGLPGLTIVGLPDTAVTEARERVRAAIKNSGFAFPRNKVVVNLAPADIKKEGTGLDLPLAVGILLAAGCIVETDTLPTTCFVGELSLEGNLRRINGALSVAIMAKKLGYSALVVPEENVAEASLVEGLDVFGLARLDQLPVFLVHPHSFSQPIDRDKLLAHAAERSSPFAIDFADVKGQAQAKRALTIAAAGGHNTLMAGPPGSGKSMLAKALASILPPLSFGEMLEVSRIYSVAGLLKPTAERSGDAQQGLLLHRPFRSPHHTASMAGLTGGGSNPRPGEITLAHRGVLFLDEFVEFPRNVLEILRQPLEDGVITISRAQQAVTFPAQFMLVAALNPCPCGYKGDSQQACICSDSSVQRYMGKLSGPLLDRIDLHLEVPRLTHQELVHAPPGETSAVVSERVRKARNRQQERFENSASAANSLCNAHMTAGEIRTHCVLSPDALPLLEMATKKMNLSARAYDRTLRLSRTIADLAECEVIESQHLAEALQYRGLERLMPRPGLPLPV